MSPQVPETAPVYAGLYGLWGTAADNVISVGSAGLVFHYDGNPDGSWALMDSGTESRLKAIWGSAADNVYAVGQDGTILHYDDNIDGSWSPLTSGVTAELHGIWGFSADDIYVVGAEGTVLHYDGNAEGTWTPMSSGTSKELHAVWGLSSSNLYAAGQDGTILHYDGNTARTWTAMDSGTQELISNLWGSSHDNIFAMGYTDFGRPGVVLRYDGVPANQDNCPDHYNPDQQDSDNNSTGDVCESTSSAICPLERVYDPDAAETKMLRRYRDAVLQKTPGGLKLVRLYYEWSPTILKVLEADVHCVKKIRAVLDGFLPLIEKKTGKQNQK